MKNVCYCRLITLTGFSSEPLQVKNISMPASDPLYQDPPRTLAAAPSPTPSLPQPVPTVRVVATKPPENSDEETETSESGAVIDA
jgi:hypothetical protein